MVATAHWLLSRRVSARTLAVLAVLMTLVLSTDVAQAQFDGVYQDVIGRGRLEYSEAVGGPADVYVGWILMDPGSTYGGWHTHPGPVWVVINGGELALYGPDGCRTLYSAGAAYVARPDTLYDLRNEGTQPLELAFAGVFRAGQPATMAAEAPDVTCPR